MKKKVVKYKYKKKKVRVIPERQKRLIKKLSENGVKTIGRAMLEVGYAKEYADTPSKLQNTDSWKRLLRKYLPDSRLTKVAREGLKATMIKSSFTEPDRVLPDYNVRHKYLETALKMKGKLIERTDITTDGDKVAGFTFVAPQPKPRLDGEDVEQPT